MLERYLLQRYYSSDLMHFITWSLVGYLLLDTRLMHRQSLDLNKRSCVILAMFSLLWPKYLAKKYNIDQQALAPVGRP